MLFSWLRGTRRQTKGAPPRRRARLGVEVLEDRAVPAVITVNDVSDAVTAGGPFGAQTTLSLRLAIDLTDGNIGVGALTPRQALLVNGVPNGAQPDTIQFAFQGAGPFVISPTSALDPITHSVIIDGTSQAGFTADPIVVLDGLNARVGSDGLDLQASNSSIIALNIRHFNRHGIFITGNNNQIQDCFIGTDETGVNAQANGADGILIEGAAGNTIGGATAGTGNLISGNGWNGIQITGQDAQGNLVERNAIGTNDAQTQALPNSQDGVLLAGSASNNTIGGF